MGKVKTALIAVACILFGLCIWGYISGWTGRILIVIILLHSLCLIALAFIFSAEREDYTGTEDLQQQLAVLQTEGEVEKTTMQRALEAMEKEVRVRDEELERLRNDVSDYKSKITGLEKAVSSAESQIEFMQSDINDFLPPAEDDPILIDIIKIAKETIDELAVSARKAGVNARVSSSEESIFVKAQSSRVRILFRNIIDNSIKYMNKSGSLVITISSIEDDIFIVCKDTGEGLAEDETKHIFELNYQGSNRISGNGLGLTQAKAIVDYYGGTIYGKSSPGKGMGIYIQLPTSSRVEEAAG